MTTPSSISSPTPSNWKTVEPIRFDHGQLSLLDQRVLPHTHNYIHYTDAMDVANAIADMVVRGAPAIGITAAYGIVLAALKQKQTDRLNLDADFDALARSRPTAVNLFWALDKMRTALQANLHLPIPEQISQLEQAAHDILKNDIQANQTMGELGASLIDAGSQVYTHCNAGALATGGYGTALGVIRSAFAQNKVTHVYAGETRPWLQGARLTAWELMQDNIPVTLSSEGAAGQLLRQGNVKWIIVGADRIAANGDVANKIGTYNLAVLAKHHGIKFMVVAPTTTFDLSIEDGWAIPIEDRANNEVTHIHGIQMAPANCHAINPSFDMTPNDLIDAIVCEEGILTAPFQQNIARCLRK